MSKARGQFITLEGIDGAGKSTHMGFIEELLTDAGYEVIRTREPGGTRLGEKLREVVLREDGSVICADAETLMIFAARAQHLTEIIEPALAAGKWVLCDRFTDATYAYQGGGRGVASERIAVLEQWVQQGRRPDLTMLFDLPVDVALGRSGKRGASDRFEGETTPFAEAVRKSYLKIADNEVNRVHVVLAASSPIHVQQQLRVIVNKFIEYIETSLE